MPDASVATFTLVSVTSPLSVLLQPAREDITNRPIPSRLSDFEIMIALSIWVTTPASLRVLRLMT
jgi:hypothetical protein